MTSDPTARWASYIEDAKKPRSPKWDQMTLLHACETREGAWYLESLLIRWFWDTHGCHNKMNNDRGGTGRPPRGVLWYYVYIVCLRADLVHEALRKRRLLAYNP